MDNLAPKILLYKPLIKSFMKILDFSTLKIDNNKYVAFVNILDFFTSLLFLMFYTYIVGHMTAKDEQKAFPYDRKKKIIFSVILFITVISLLIIHNLTKIKIVKKKSIATTMTNIRFGISIISAAYALFRIFRSGKKLIKGIETTTVKKNNAIKSIILLVISIMTNMIGLYGVAK